MRSNFDQYLFEVSAEVEKLIGIPLSELTGVGADLRDTMGRFTPQQQAERLVREAQEGDDGI